MAARSGFGGWAVVLAACASRLLLCRYSARGRRRAVVRSGSKCAWWDRQRAGSEPSEGGRCAFCTWLFGRRPSLCTCIRRRTRTPRTHPPRSPAAPPALSVLRLCPLARHAPPSRFRRRRPIRPRVSAAPLTSALCSISARRPVSVAVPQPPRPSTSHGNPAMLRRLSPPSPSHSPAVWVCASRPSARRLVFLLAHGALLLVACACPAASPTRQRAPHPAGQAATDGRRSTRASPPLPPSLPSPFPRILLTPTRRHLQRTAQNTPLPPTLSPSSLLTLSLNALPPPLLPLPPMCHLWNAGYSLLHFPLSRIAGKRTVVHVVHAPWHTHRAWPRCQCEVSSVHWIAC